MTTRKTNKDGDMSGELFVRDVPKMPEGYYSDDRPNPTMTDFVHRCSRPYDQVSDGYEVEPFSTALDISNRRSAINDLHIYWSKKPHDAVQAYVDHYAQPGDLVLDPFSGSGGTALCALRRGCAAIAIDLSPAATFITKYYCSPVDTNEFLMAWGSVIQRVRPTLDWLYETRTENGGSAILGYTVWSQVFRCNRCWHLIPLGLCDEAPARNKDGSLRKSRTGEPATVLVCPECAQRGLHEPIDTSSARFGRVPLRARAFGLRNGKRKWSTRVYKFPSRLGESAAEVSLEDLRESCDSDAARFDIDRLIEIRDTPIPFDYPTSRMMNMPPDVQKWGVLWRSGVADFVTVDELFEKRALWALSAYFDAVRDSSCSRDVVDAMLGVMSSALWNCSMMYRERKTGGGPQEGVYYLPPLSREVNVGNVIAGKAETFLQANRAIADSLQSTNLLISTQSATDMTAIASNSVDYIFTDPPYSWKVPYGELNFLWESFLGFDTHWHQDEIIVSDARDIDEVEWAGRMKCAFEECYRVLKPGRCLTLCYHDSAEGTWALIQDVLAECGFIAEQTNSAIYIGTGQKSLKQLTSGQITQRDLVINFRKPRLDEAYSAAGLLSDAVDADFGDKARAIIRDYLSERPGSARDRIYDEVVSRMVRAGQMEAHNFDELLRQVAEEVCEPVPESSFDNKRPDFGSHEMGRWYLRESEVGAVDAAESAKEDAAARKIRDFISEWLTDNPGVEGVHYSDVFEHYVYGVKDKPRRSLADWLLDYFYKTDSGTYRLPGSEEEERIKAEARASGTSRRIKHYIAHLQQGTPVMDRDRPSDATLAEWIRHCKRFGLYEQGKLLYERGGLNQNNLTEEAMVNVEEDYQVCARMLARNGGNEKKTRKRGG